MDAGTPLSGQQPTSSQQPPVPPRPSPYTSASASPGYGSYAMNRFSPFTSGYGMGGFSPPGYGFGGGYGGSFGGGYGGYSSGMYGASAYGAGAGGAYGYGGYSNPAPESELIRVAEERSRAAFQSIESFLQAFQSISMMLDSSYWALASSFRAVLSVAEHFSRLRLQLGSAVANLAIVRTMMYTLRLLLRWLGLEGVLLSPPTNPVELAWRQAQSAAGDSPLSDAILTPDAISQAGKANWPIVAFFSVALGTPIVIYKLLQGITSPEQSQRLHPGHGWARGLGEHFVAYANYDFVGERNHTFAGFRELSFRSGDKLLIAPKELQGASKGWLLAARKGKIGLVPYTYMSQPYKVTPAVNATSASAVADQVVNESTKSADASAESDSNPLITNHSSEGDQSS